MQPGPLWSRFLKNLDLRPFTFDNSLPTDYKGDEL